LIGLDFDNTLVDYTVAFREEAAALGLSLPGASKTRIRDTLRRQPDGEILWQKLQARVYGPAIERAEIMPGALAFLDACRARGIVLAIVSHKTRYAAQDPGGVDLRDAATAWLRRNGIGIQPENVFFEDTRQQKLKRIEALRCTHFVDDLTEVLVDPAFPPSTRRLWFVTAGETSAPPIDMAGDWDEIASYLFS